ncbi:probable G-protein coupled receptor Mth-like 7 [Drosophila biarmipes]|uniref:probable G-protein coupled receptor Mth-like 7 n=1 Tax=Drosophila biarmipes TaxID=125945 RepID=UPI0021CD010D|nr:probable G-protein coupled receptor Mth-like 7 [Drosophila biarmipes]
MIGLLLIMDTLYVMNLRNRLDKCLICSLLCVSANYLNSMMDIFEFTLTACRTFYFEIAYNLWCSVICIQLHSVFKSRFESSSRFLVSSSFVWVTPLVLFGLTRWLLFYCVGSPDQIVLDWINDFGVFPLLILNTFNGIMLILTAIYVYKAKGALNRLTQQENPARSSSNFSKETFLQSLQIYSIMCLAWILLMTCLLLTTLNVWKPAFKYFYYGFGISLLVLAILKRCTRLEEGEPDNSNEVSSSEKVFFGLCRVRNAFHNIHVKE